MIYKDTKEFLKYLDNMEANIEPWIDRGLQLAGLIEVFGDINSTLDLNKVLMRIMKSAERVMHAEASSLMMRDEETDELIISVPTGPATAKLSGFRVPSGKGISGWVAAHGQPTAVPDVSKDPRFYGNVDEESGFQTKSIVCVPMKNQEGKIIGVLQVLNRIDGNPFTDEDIPLFTAFADQAAIAIENARLHIEELAKERLERELILARQIQQGFWPENPLPIDGLSIAGMSHPAMDVGGDYYDFIPITDNQLGIIVGDISGKGISAALLMATFRAALRAQIDINRSASDTISLVNNSIVRDTPPEKYLTLFYGVFDTNTRQLIYVNGGHTPGFLYNAHSKEEKYLDLGGTLVGFLENFPFEEGEESLESGSVLLLFSDGATDALNMDDEEFGFERLYALVREHCHLDAKGLIDVIYQNIIQFSKGASQFDDITMIVLKIE